MIQTPMVECKYGWGQTLRLYQDHIELHGVSYPLHDLVHFRPVYRSLVGLSIMRLELQFNNNVIYVRNITNIHAGLQVTLYLNRWLNAQGLLAQEEDVPEDLSFPVSGQPVQPSSSPAYLLLPEAVVDAGQIVEAESLQVESEVVSSSSSPILPDAPLLEVEAVRSWPWTEERYEQRMQRLKMLQVKRELQIYGFDVSALLQQLRSAGLPRVSVPLHMMHGEVAHYRTEAMLCDDAPASVHLPGARWKGKDRGIFILTNKRVVFLGRKRQIVLYYERMRQISQLPGAIMLHAEYWTHQQYFVMRRPLECTMYFEHILQKLQQPPLVEHSAYQLLAPS